jgi:hypothetical protein
MSDTTNRVWGKVRNNIPLLCGIVLSAVLFIYLLFPGVVIGLLVRAGFFDPNQASEKALGVIDTVFCVPFFLSDHITPLGRFYDWQFFQVSGYEAR